MSSLAVEHKQIVQSLYRQSLRLSRDWINRRDLWRAKAIEIRQEFDEHKNITDKHEIIVSGCAGQEFCVIVMIYYCTLMF